jgi:hypothetical protein
LKQFTLRGIDPQIEKKIRFLANERQQSINQVLVTIIHQSLGKGKKSSRAASLERFAGGWSEKEAADFNRAIQVFEQIDEEKWR